MVDSVNKRIKDGHGLIIRTTFQECSHSRKTIDTTVGNESPSSNNKNITINYSIITFAAITIVITTNNTWRISYSNQHIIQLSIKNETVNGSIVHSLIQ